MKGTGITITGAIGTVVVIPVDLYFPYVTLLLSGDGTNAAQNNTFTDSSTNNFTVTRNGTPTQGTFTPYGSNWSNYFNGSSTYQSTPQNVAYNFGTGDFTVEGFFYFWGAFTTFYNGLINLGNGASGGGPYTGWGLITGSTGGDIRWYRYDGTTETQYTGTYTFNVGTWYHIAVTRSGTDLAIFVNGVRIVATTSSISYNNINSDPLNIAYRNDGVSGITYAKIYTSNIRIVKGTSVYSPTSTTLTVPTSPLTAIANTSLLICQSNRFIDNSTNAFAVTGTGSPSVERFSPFNPGSAYSTTVIGGSGYFNSTSDYLALTNNAAFKPGASTNPFCIECWIYPTATPGTNLAVLGNYTVVSYPTNTNGFDIITNSSNQVTFRWGYPNYADAGNSAAMSLNTWNHVVVCRNSSGSLSCYLNGTRWFNSSSNTSITDGTASSFWVGWAGSLSGTTINPFTGYISDVRLVKGSTPYDPTLSTLTPPTSPATAVANTSLLTSFTNAGVYDSSEMNDLITAGSTQISTSVKKYGTASISFAGAGNYLSMPASGGLNFGTGDFTIETWVYFNSLANLPFLFQKMSGTTGWFIEVSASTVYFGWGSASGSQYIAFSVSLSTGAWYHLAVTRTGSTLNAFVNGTSPGSQTLASANLSYDNSVNATIGGFYAGTTTYDLNGYIDDFRITRGYVRYPSNFTAPTATLPTQ